MTIIAAPEEYTTFRRNQQFKQEILIYGNVQQVVLS